METQCNVERYAQRILRKIGESFQIELRCESLAEESKDKYYSKILKSGIVTDGTDILITSAVITLNLRKLNTIAKVRRAISHELAHLFPTKEDFASRWSFWNTSLKKFEETLHEQETYEKEGSSPSLENISTVRIL